MRFEEKLGRSLKNGVRRDEEVPGIVILDGGQGVRAELRLPRVHAFVYGEPVAAAPTLPFGRWKAAS